MTQVSSASYSSNNSDSRLFDHTSFPYPVVTVAPLHALALPALSVPPRPQPVPIIAEVIEEVIAHDPRLSHDMEVVPPMNRVDTDLIQGDAIAAIEAVFPPEVWNEAKAIAWCESGLNATNTNNPTHAGLFQISYRYQRARWERMGFDESQMYEAIPNTQVAYAIWAEQGWAPWQCRSVINDPARNPFYGLPPGESQATPTEPTS